MTVPIRARRTASTASARPRRAKRITSPASTRRSEYRSSTESRKAPNGETWPVTRASAPSRMSSAPATARKRAPARRWSAAKATAAIIEATRPKQESWLGRTRSPTIARATGSATRPTSALYRPSIGSRLAGEGRRDGGAHAGDRVRHLHLVARAVCHVEGVEGMVQIGRDLRGRDVEPLAGQGTRDEVEEAEPVRRLHLHDGVSVGERVVHRHPRRPG